MKTLKDLYKIMIDSNQEGTVQELKSGNPQSLNMIHASIDSEYILGDEEFNLKKFTTFLLEEYLFDILRSGELKGCFAVEILEDPLKRRFRRIELLKTDKMDIEEYIKTLREEWNKRDNENDIYAFAESIEFAEPHGYLYSN
jgi:hypothetical protein